MEKHYNFNEFEKKAQKIWEENQTYRQEPQGPVYSIDTPPPTVSGSLHIGHIFSYTQADIIARYKRMSGFSVLYPMGFDDNGLATERYVEKKLGIQSHSLTREEFIATCLTEIKPAEKDFENLFKSIGLSIDWTKKYSTINQNSRKISQLSFIKLYEKGLAYRKAEPAIYCTGCKTTISQADLEDAQKKSNFNDILFEIPSQNKNIIISTTRPELLSSVVAILYHPNDERYQLLKDARAIVPIYGHEVPLLPDADVDPEKGTGIVMVSTFGDKQDIIWAKRYNFEYKQAIGRDGLMTELAGPLKGIYANDGRKKIIALLQEQNLLVGQKETTHTVNVHERCKREVEYLIFPQWFLKILPYKEKFISLADDINWHPQFMKSRYINWVENLTWDWCLSRQRFYGIPFPIWYCKKCNETLLADSKDLPVDPQTQRYPSQCTQCGSSEIEPETDAMDTWNTSSLTPYICSELVSKELSNEQTGDLFEANKLIPMSMRPQAHDIIRTWAFYTIVKSYFHSGTIPWKDIVISGHVLSTAKEKISKSKGNNPLEPKNLLECYPADAIRYWTATGSLGYDTAFSEAQISIGNRLLTKLWNAFKFTKEYLGNYKENHAPNIKSISNRWILVTLNYQFSEYKKAFENYEFAHALDKIDRFFWHSFCDNYLELIKDQLFNQHNHKPEDIYETLWTLNKVGLIILQMYAPFIPHMTETLYQIVYNPLDSTNPTLKNSIHSTQFEKVLQEHLIGEYTADATMMNKILDIISSIRKFKSESKVSLKTDIELLKLCTHDKDLENTLKNEMSLLQGIARAKNIQFTEIAESTIYQDQDLWYIDLLA